MDFARAAWTWGKEINMPLLTTVTYFRFHEDLPRPYLVVEIMNCKPTKKGWTTGEEFWNQLIKANELWAIIRALTHSSRNIQRQMHFTHPITGFRNRRNRMVWEIRLDIERAYYWADTAELTPDWTPVALNRGPIPKGDRAVYKIIEVLRVLRRCSATLAALHEICGANALAWYDGQDSDRLNFWIKLPWIRHEVNDHHYAPNFDIARASFADELRDTFCLDMPEVDVSRAQTESGHRQGSLRVSFQRAAFARTYRLLQHWYPEQGEHGMLVFRGASSHRLFRLTPWKDKEVRQHGTDHLRIPSILPHERAPLENVLAAGSPYRPLNLIPSPMPSPKKRALERWKSMSWPDRLMAASNKVPHFVYDHANHDVQLYWRTQDGNDVDLKRAASAHHTESSSYPIWLLHNAAANDEQAAQFYANAQAAKQQYRDNIKALTASAQYSTDERANDDNQLDLEFENDDDDDDDDDGDTDIGNLSTHSRPSARSNRTQMSHSTHSSRTTRSDHIYTHKIKKRVFGPPTDAFGPAGYQSERPHGLKIKPAHKKTRLPPPPSYASHNYQGSKHGHHHPQQRGYETDASMVDLDYGLQSPQPWHHKKGAHFSEPIDLTGDDTDAPVYTPHSAKHSNGPWDDRVLPLYRRTFNSPIRHYPKPKNPENPSWTDSGQRTPPPYDLKLPDFPQGTPDQEFSDDADPESANEEKNPFMAKDIQPTAGGPADGALPDGGGTDVGANDEQHPTPFTSYKSSAGFPYTHPFGTGHTNKTDDVLNQRTPSLSPSFPPRRGSRGSADQPPDKTAGNDEYIDENDL